MIKFKQGYVTNTETGETSDIVVKATAPNRLIDALIGGGFVMIGIAYLTITAFKYGSERYEICELEALDECYLLQDV